MEKKNYEDLTFTDDYIFWKVLTTNLDLCQELLELILEKKIAKVELVGGQKTIEESRDARGVRLDVYVEGSKEVYSVEMQTNRRRNLPKRVRYYQGMVCLSLLERGEDYEELKISYVIFICTFDFFGKGLVKYTFDYRCEELPELALEDGTKNIFVNGAAKDIPGKMGEFIKFLSGEVSGELSQRLQKAVDIVKLSAEGRREYMTLYMRDLENRREGREEGREEGEERLSALINCLIKDNLIDMISIVTNDKEKRNEMYKKYNLL